MKSENQIAEKRFLFLKRDAFSKTPVSHKVKERRGCRDTDIESNGGKER